MAGTVNKAQVVASSTLNSRPSMDAIKRAAVHVAQARRDLLTGDPIELARLAHDSAYGPSLSELETRIRVFQSRAV